MKSQIFGLRAAGTVLRWFALAISYGSSHKLTCSSQAARCLSGVNAVGVLIAGGLSLWMWRLSACAAKMRMQLS